MLLELTCLICKLHYTDGYKLMRTYGTGSMRDSFTGTFICEKCYVHLLKWLDKEADKEKLSWDNPSSRK